MNVFVVICMENMEKLVILNVVWCKYDTTTKCGNGYKNSVYKILSIKVKEIKLAFFAGKT